MEDLFGLVHQVVFICLTIFPIPDEFLYGGLMIINMVFWDGQRL